MVELPNYVQVPHEVFRHLKVLTGNEVKVLLSICRKTFGYHKLTDDISYSQIEEMCGVSRANASRAVKRLCELDLVEKSTKKGKTTRYDMKVMCVKTTQEDPGTVVKTTTLTVAKTTHTKEKDKESIDTTSVVSRGVPDPELKPLVRYFYDKHEEVRGIPPTPAWPRDMAIMKRLRVAGEYEPGAIRQCIDAFFAYPGRLKTGVRDFSNSIDNIYCYLQDEAAGKIKWQKR